MAQNKNREIIRQFGINPLKPDSFQVLNEPLINNLFLWSAQNISLVDIIQNFFGIKVRTKLIAILLDLDLNSWIGIGASWQPNNQQGQQGQNGQIRMDSKLTEFFLNKAFGESPINRPFNIKKVNQLELNILQAFLGTLETKMKDYWEIDTKYPYLMDSIYLVWLVESDESEIGKVAFSMPASFKPKSPKQSTTPDFIDINKLANTGIMLPIDLILGSTKLTFNEIKSFEKGDLIIFENSDISKLYWHFGEIGVVIPEEDHPVFIKDIESIQELVEEMKRTTQIDEDPLSSLPLELSAQFHKVLISLKQVLELKSGGVLPLGPILDSELILSAQGKPVAKGELIIVGNQFGMRVTEILIGSKKQGKGSSGSVEIEDLLGAGEKSIKTEQQGSFVEELKDLEES